MYTVLLVSVSIHQQESFKMHFKMSVDSAGFLR